LSEAKNRTTERQWQPFVDVREVMGRGHMSVLSDPTDATIALWQPTKA
jgi:hypothetical protein